MNSINRRLEQINEKLAKQRARELEEAKSNDVKVKRVVQSRMSIKSPCCMICNKKFERDIDRHLDYNLKKPRGILCHNCIVGINMFKCELDVLKSAVRYLERYQYKEGDEFKIII